MDEESLAIRLGGQKYLLGQKNGLVSFISLVNHTFSTVFANVLFVIFYNKMLYL